MRKGIFISVLFISLRKVFVMPKNEYIIVIKSFNGEHVFIIFPVFHFPKKIESFGKCWKSKK